MKAGIQTFLQEAGEAACYALSIIKIAEEVLDKELPVVESLLIGIDKGYIHYTWDNPNDNDNFFVSEPALFLSELIGRQVRIRRIEGAEVANWHAKDNEYTVQCWQRNKTGTVITHFRRPTWDSLVNSVTVRLGKLVSLRVFTVL